MAARSRRPSLTRAAAPLLCLAPLLHGCIAWDIRDQLIVANQSLDDVNEQLARTNDRLAALDLQLQRIEATNNSLAMITDQLAALDDTNESLVLLQKRTELLEAIERSLNSLDRSLITVRELIEKIPFVGSSPEPEPEPEPEPDAPPTAPPPPPAP